MTFLSLLLATAASLVFLAIVFIPLEKVFAAKPLQKTFRPNWFLDLCFFLGQYLVWSGLVLLGINYIAGWCDAIMPISFRNNIRAQPTWLQAIEVIFFSDLLIYWGHRLQHRVDFLWRFHKVHHTTENMDWLAAHREHPIDSIYTVGLINLPAIIMGFPLEILAAVIAFRGIWAIYIHSNVRLPIGLLKKIIGAPELHHWHHDLNRDAGNYANLSPIMDILFGTYICPDQEPESFGIKEEFSKNYVGQMLQPMLPARLWRKLKFSTKLSRQKNLNHS